ncbi:MAG: DUF3276 family protein [Tepidisphaeraceae bacterium]
MASVMNAPRQNAFGNGRRSGMGAGARPTTAKPGTGRSGGDRKEEIPHPILFQQFFKSVGPRTYAAQVKKATNGNHYLVLTEGRRDDKTGEVYKKRLNVFSEDFEPFLDLIRAFAAFNKAHPVPDNVRQRQAALWKKKRGRKTLAAASAVSG